MIALLVALLVQVVDPATPDARTAAGSARQSPSRGGAGTLPGSPNSIDPMARYLSDLEQAGVLGGDQQPATLERLRGELAAAEDDLVTGNAEIASVRLYRIVESPRYAQFEYAPDYATAELTLARALIRAGGYKSAERYLLRVLGRDAKSPLFAPAYRMMVDVALETKEQAEILAARLHDLRRATFRQLTADCAGTFEVVARFLAVLELFRDSRITLDQLVPLGDLYISWSDAPPSGDESHADEEDD